MRIQFLPVDGIHVGENDDIRNKGRGQLTARTGWPASSSTLQSTAALLVLRVLPGSGPHLPSTGHFCYDSVKDFCKYLLISSLRVNW